MVFAIIVCRFIYKQKNTFFRSITYFYFAKSRFVILQRFSHITLYLLNSFGIGGVRA